MLMLLTLLLSTRTSLDVGAADVNAILASAAAGDEEVDWADDFESEEQMDQFDDDEAFQCDDAGTYADDP